MYVTNKLGIGVTNPTYRLEVDGSFNNTGGAKIVIQGNTNGGSDRGIFLLNKDNTDYGIYLASSLNGTTLSNTPPCSILDISNLATCENIVSCWLHIQIDALNFANNHSYSNTLWQIWATTL